MKIPSTHTRAAGKPPGRRSKENQLLRVQCPNSRCGKESLVRPTHRGRRVRCKACGNVFRLEDSGAGPPAAENTEASESPTIVEQTRFLSAWGVGILGFVSACLGLFIVAVSLDGWLQAPSPYAMLFFSGLAVLGLVIGAYGCKWMYESTR